ncbi:MAG: hypothetical protein HYZ42_12795, partial [Bacteroidetes bacterium]|nr:hypothetical protein [Bacteroidota bacterium]
MSSNYSSFHQPHPFIIHESGRFATVKNLLYFLITGKVDEHRVRNAEIERKKMNAFFKKLYRKKYLFLPTYSNSII